MRALDFVGEECVSLRCAGPKEGRSADEQDAHAAARWLTDMGARGALAGYFAPPLTDLERAPAEREGWILGGVM